MHHDEGEGGGQLDAEIPVGHAVEGIGGHAVHSEGLGHRFPVEGVGGGGEGAASQRGDVHPADGAVQPLDVPGEHLGVGHQVMAEGDGLRPLEVGVAGQDGGGVRLRLAAQDAHQLEKLRPQGGGGAPQIEADVQRHLVVAAAPGVEPFARVADAGGQLPFNKGMDVLRILVDGQRAGSEIGGDARQPVLDRLPVLGGKDPLFGQHGGVRHAARDVLLRHAGIKRDGGIKIVGFLIEFLLEPSGPQLHMSVSCP